MRSAKLRCVARSCEVASRSYDAWRDVTSRSHFATSRSDFALRIATSRYASQLREATSRSQGIMDCMRTEENLPRDLVFTQEDQKRLPAFERRPCTSGLTHLNYLLHCKSVTTCPNGKVTTCPNVIFDHEICSCRKIWCRLKVRYFHITTSRCIRIIYRPIIHYYFLKGLACMYKELFKNSFFFHMAYLCRAWEDSCDFTIDLLKIIILNILPSCGNICISSFRCSPSVTTCTCYN